MPVRDLGAAIGWYERLAGRTPDLIPNEREAEWRINRVKLGQTPAR
jgi:hypothetical protein